MFSIWKNSSCLYWIQTNFGCETEYIYRVAATLSQKITRRKWFPRMKLLQPSEWFESFCWFCIFSSIIASRLAACSASVFALFSNLLMSTILFSLYVLCLISLSKIPDATLYQAPISYISHFKCRSIPNEVPDDRT